jgi:hypothetical protein
MKADGDKRIHKLQRAFEHDRAEAREQAYQTQRLYAAAFADLLEGLRADLEAVPPNHDAASASCSPMQAGRPSASDFSSTTATARRLLRPHILGVSARRHRELS